MSEWKETTISEIVTLIGGGTPKTSVSEYWDGHIPWLSVVDFNNEKKYVFDTEKKITEEGLNNSSTKLLEKGDIIISARGTVGVVAMLGKQMAFNQSCYGVRANEKSSNEYVYYLLKDRVSNFLQYSHGGVFDTITRDTFKEIDILLPPPDEQHAIASVLSRLDDKIDLLHRQNQTLEQMAETLFRQWFVEEADEGWEEGSIYEVLNVVYGYPFKSKRFNEEGVGLPLIRIRDLKKGESQFYTDEECDSKFEINCGDLIAGMDGEFRLYLWKGKKSLLNQRVCKFEPKDLSIPPLFIFGLMKPHLHYYENVKVGTTVIHLGKSDLDEIRIQVPDHDTLIEFGKITNPMFEKLKVNYKQIRTLTALRDTMLPKLMSGEVKVSEL